MVTHFVNCTNKTMRIADTDSNSVLNLRWPKNDVDRVRAIFGDKLDQVEKFIDKAHKEYTNTLVYCSNGQTRSLCVVVCFLMSRFRWNLLKTLEYMDYLKSDLEINEEYFKELQAVAEQYDQENELSDNWENNYKSPQQHREEEILVSNTFLNSKTMPLSNLSTKFFLKKEKVCRFQNKRFVIWFDDSKKAKRAKSERLSAKGITFKGKRVCKDEWKHRIKQLLRNRTLKTEMDDSVNLNENSFMKLKKNKKQDILNFFSKGTKLKNRRLGKKNNKSNSISKSTNAQDDLSNLEEDRSDKLKTISEKAMKNSYLKSFDASFINNPKPFKIKRKLEQKKEALKKKSSVSRERHMLETFGKLEKLEKPNKALFIKNRFKEYRSVENNDLQNRVQIKKRLQSSKEKKPKKKKYRPESIPLKGKLSRI